VITMRNLASHRLARVGWLAAAVAVLVGVFTLYTRPGFLAMLIDQLWACF
jgi:hypothetical protein